MINFHWLYQVYSMLSQKTVLDLLDNAILNTDNAILNKVDEFKCVNLSSHIAFITFRSTGRNSQLELIYTAWLLESFRGLSVDYKYLWSR